MESWWLSPNNVATVAAIVVLRVPNLMSCLLQEASLVQKLFKFLFQMLVHKDVTRMMDAAEGKSFPFVSTLTNLVEKCLALVEEKPDPLGYLQLLLYLFKLLHKFKLLFQVHSMSLIMVCGTALLGFDGTNQAGWVQKSGDMDTADELGRLGIKSYNNSDGLTSLSNMKTC